MNLKKITIFLILTLTIYITGCNNAQDFDTIYKPKETIEEEELRNELKHKNLEEIQEGEFFEFDEVTVLHIAKEHQNYIVFLIKDDNLSGITNDIHVSFDDSFEGLPHKIGITATDALTILAYETENRQKRQIDKFFFRNEPANVIYEKSL